MVLLPSHKITEACGCNKQNRVLFTTHREIVLWIASCDTYEVLERCFCILYYPKKHGKCML